MLKLYIDGDNTVFVKASKIAYVELGEYVNCKLMQISIEDAYLYQFDLFDETELIYIGELKPTFEWSN